MDMQTLLGCGAAERPLQHLVSDGGYCGIFRTIGCVGDSLSSGEFEAINADGQKTYHDMFDYSWGQYLARMAGCKVYNFSRGGMTAKEYCESFAADNGFWDADKACQAYILALGVNDLYGMDMPVGTLEDICPQDPTQNAPTFAGYYARIIQQLKAIQPRAHFFLMTMPRDGVDTAAARRMRGDMHAALLYDMAGYFANTWVLDLRRYGPVYDTAFCQRFFMGGHMNPMGYVFTAKLTASYIDYILRHNAAAFRQAGFIGTDLVYKP